MHPATPAADMKIVAAVDELNRCSAAFGLVRKDLAALRLPIAAVGDKLDHVDDLAAIISRMIDDAADLLEADFTRILKADDARYCDAANDDEVAFARDQGLSALQAKLSGGVL